MYPVKHMEECPRLLVCMLYGKIVDLKAYDHASNCAISLCIAEAYFYQKHKKMRQIAPLYYAFRGCVFLSQCIRTCPQLTHYIMLYVFIFAHKGSYLSYCLFMIVFHLFLHYAAVFVPDSASTGFNLP